jgi:hypothetical protein
MVIAIILKKNHSYVFSLHSTLSICLAFSSLEDSILPPTSTEAKPFYVRNKHFSSQGFTSTDSQIRLNAGRGTNLVDLTKTDKKQEEG